MSKTKKKMSENVHKKKNKKSRSKKKLSFFPPQNKKKKTIPKLLPKENSTIITDKNYDHNQANSSESRENVKNSNKLTKPNKINTLSLRERMMYKLKSARFRYINEELYSLESTKSLKLFQFDPNAFKIYHEGYQQQVAQWPLNPLDEIIDDIKKHSKDSIIADFGCGEGKLAESVPHKVYSFDLVAVNNKIIAGDMSHTCLKSGSINIAVFCLSLMNTNIHDYFKEANRVLMKNGILKIAEVASRFDDVNNFIKAVTKFGFRFISNDFSHNLFYFFNFQKTFNANYSRNLPKISLLPCLYKKR